MTFGGGNLRGQNIPVAWQNWSQLTAENSGHSQLIFKLLNTPILRKMDSSNCFPSTRSPINCHISDRPYSKSSENSSVTIQWFIDAARQGVLLKVKKQYLF
jgi:hypothetical protein